MRKSLIYVSAVVAALLVVGPSNLCADIVNGNFTAGTTGFTSPGGMWVEGTYAIATNPQNYHPLWASFGDHTTGVGNMMIVNGAPTDGKDVWVGNNNTALSPGIYMFSAWVAALYSANPAELNFSIGSTPLGTFTTSTNPGEWQEFTATFAYGGGSPPFASVDLNIARDGNDFALDDIHLQQVPDGGTTAMLLGLALAAGRLVQRRLK